MQRHREEAGLKVFICLPAGCVKLKMCEEEGTQTVMKPASKRSAIVPGRTVEFSTLHVTQAHGELPLKPFPAFSHSAVYIEPTDWIHWKEKASG